MGLIQSLRSRRRNHKTSSSSRRPLRPAPAMSLEAMEGRRLYSATFNSVGTLETPAAADYGYFGQIVATKGALAAVGDANGVVRLFDTSTGSQIDSFTDPGGDGAGSFGLALTFVGSDKLAVSSAGATGAGKVVVFDLTDHTAVTLTAESVVGFNELTWAAWPGFGKAIAEHNGNLLIDVSADASVGYNGRVVEVNPSSGTILHSYSNPSADASSFVYDSFGSHIAVSGDQILFYANESTDGGLGNQVVYHFDGADFLDASGNVRALSDPSGDPMLFFGTSLAFSGDDIVVGSPGSDYSINWDTYEFNQFGGSVYHYSAVTDQLVQTFSLPAGYAIPGYSAFSFGSGLAVSGDTLVIGASTTFNSTMDDYAGTAFAFDLRTGALIDAVTNPADHGGFGNAIAALDGDNFLIADYNDSSAAFWSGKAYVFSVTEITNQGNAVTPAADAGDDQAATAGDTVTFTGNGTAPTGSSIVSYEWDFNYNGGTFNASASGQSASQLFDTPGAYTVALRVTDDHGRSAIDTLVLTIADPA
jgi:hypothetical protein